MLGTVADDVVELHGSLVDVADLGHHAVEVERLDKHPRRRAHEEVVQHDGDRCAAQL